MEHQLNKNCFNSSISLILASGLMMSTANAADDVKLKATKPMLPLQDFTPTEYSTKGKPNIIVLIMDDLGYGQLPLMIVHLTLKRWITEMLLIHTK